jgi:anti-sigma factor RsiW
MQCSDLERYLEAYLDLRLGRSRGAILRRHLSACPSCRARVEHLRQFERDLQHSFRAMERAQSVWSGLEPDLVRSGGLAEAAPLLPFLGPVDPARSPAPPPAVGSRPRQAAVRPEISVARARARRMTMRRWGQRIAGLVLIAASVGAVVPVWRSWSGGGTVEAPVRAYMELRGSDNAVIQFPTSNPDSLHSWLAPRLGEGFPLLPAPAGFELVGGGVDERASTVQAFVVYHRAGEPTLLYVTPQASEPVDSAPVASSRDGVNLLSWARSGYAYSVVSPLPETALASFTLAEAQPL